MKIPSRLTTQEDRLAGLAKRVEADAQDVLRAYRSQGEWAEPFVRLAPWLIPAAAAALAALWLLPPPPAQTPEPPSIVEQSLGPSDRAGAQFVFSPQSPPAPTLFGLEER